MTLTDECVESDTPTRVWAWSGLAMPQFRAVTQSITSLNGPWAEPLVRVSLGLPTAWLTVGSGL